MQDYIIHPAALPFLEKMKGQQPPLPFLQCNQQPQVKFLGLNEYSPCDLQQRSTLSIYPQLQISPQS
jgi:hypothetical protein